VLTEGRTEKSITIYLASSLRSLGGYNYQLLSYISVTLQGSINGRNGELVECICNESLHTWVSYWLQPYWNVPCGGRKVGLVCLPPCTKHTRAAIMLQPPCMPQNR